MAFISRATVLRVVLMAGAEPKGHPANVKTGDVIHVFRRGSIQCLTDPAIDPAGNVWVANNWNDFSVTTSGDPAYPIST